MTDDISILYNQRCIARSSPTHPVLSCTHNSIAFGISILQLVGSLRPRYVVPGDYRIPQSDYTVSTRVARTGFDIFRCVVPVQPPNNFDRRFLDLDRIRSIFPSLFPRRSHDSSVYRCYQDTHRRSILNQVTLNAAAVSNDLPPRFRFIARRDLLVDQPPATLYRRRRVQQDGSYFKSETNEGSSLRRS